VIAPIPSIGAVGAPSPSDLSKLAAAAMPQMPAPMAPLTPVSEVADPTRTPAAGGFGAILNRAVGGLSDSLNTADRMQQLAATGQLADPTQAIVATTQAELSLSTAIQVRNKLVEGWQELSRMSV